MRPQYSFRLRRIAPKIQNEIRRYRLLSGLTQRELARQCGVRLSTYSCWELGMTCPALPLAIRLARLLQISVQALYPEMFLAREHEGRNALKA